MSSDSPQSYKKTAPYAADLDVDTRNIRRYERKPAPQKQHTESAVAQTPSAAHQPALAQKSTAYIGVMGQALQRKEDAKEGAAAARSRPALSKDKSVAAAAIQSSASRPAATQERSPKPSPQASELHSKAEQLRNMFPDSVKKDQQRPAQLSSAPRTDSRSQAGRPARAATPPIVFVPQQNSHTMLLLSIGLCILLLAAFVSTPLGAPFGLYKDQRVTLSDWVGAIFQPQETAPLAMPAPAGEHSILGSPTISPEAIDRVLYSYGSPAAGQGKAFYELGKKYGIDPAYALAFFIHESSAGTNSGWAGLKPDGSSTHNVGNIICAGYATCYNRFRDYPTWAAGIEDWYRLLAVEYIEGRGVSTVEQIIPIYAPSFENNVPAYVNAVNTLVNSWRQAGGN